MKIFKTFVELFPGFRDYCYFKCDGQIPYYFAKEMNYKAIIFTSYRDNYETLKIDIPNLIIKIIEEKRIFRMRITLFYFIIKNAREIDVLYYYQIGKILRNDFIIAFLYKFLNPEGTLFIRFEADLAYVNRAYPFDSFKSQEQTVFKKLIYKLYFKKINIWGVIDFKDFSGTKEFPYLNKLTSNKIRQQLNGFNINHIISAVGEIKRFDQKENIIIASGRLGDPMKGMDVFFAALEKVDLKNWKVLLLGSDATYLKDLLYAFLKKRPELGNQVILLGFIKDRNQYFSILNKSKIYVLPSKIDGMPHVIPEAMALGNVIAGSRHHGIRVATEDGQIGRLFDVGDSDSLGSILNELINDEMKLRMLSESSFNKAHSEFEWSKIIHNVLKQDI